MIISNISKKDRIDYFQELFEEAKAKNASDTDLLDQHLRQYKGSKELDGSSVNADVVRNITYELLEAQTTSHIPAPAVSPEMYSERNERNAKTVETLLNSLRRKMPFKAMNDIDERYTYIYGGSVWLVEWDESIITHNTVGGVRVTCISPNDFVGQPGIYRVEDMEYCFVSFTTTKEDLVRRYGVSVADAERAAEESEGDDDDTAIVTTCYYKNDAGKVCEFVWSGETTLLDIDDYYARKRYVCKRCKKRKELCSCEGARYELLSDEAEELDRDITLSDGSILPAMSQRIENGQYAFDTEKRHAIDAESGLMLFDELGLPQMTEVQMPIYERTVIPYYLPDRLPIVIRKNTSQEGKLYGQSDCEFIRPQQQAINKVETRIMQKLMRSGVTPVVPEDATIAVNNSVFGSVIKLKPGESAAQYSTIDTTPNISQDIVEAERLYDHAKRLLGISDSFQGQYDSSAQSGKAKQLQIQQAAGRLQSKREMKGFAYAELYKIIFQYYLAYADEPRPAAYKDAYGRTQNYAFNRYDFIERDMLTGEYYYNDDYIFSAEESVDYESHREYMWEEARKNFQSGAYGDPASPEVRLVFWLNMEKSHYPGAHDNVERMRAEIEAARQAEQLTLENEALKGELKMHEGYEQFIQDNYGGQQ